MGLLWKSKKEREEDEEWDEIEKATAEILKHNSKKIKSRKKKKSAPKKRE